MSDDREKVSTHKCSGCGGDLLFDIDLQKLKCNYCGRTYNLETDLKNIEMDFEEGLQADSTWNKNKVVFRCKFCDSESVRNAGDIVNKCPYCGSEAIIQTSELPGIKPQRVIPFKIKKEVAQDAFLKDVKNSLYAPKDFKISAYKNSIQGVYVPSWTFDYDTHSSFVGRVGDYYTVTVGTGKNRHTETRIRWRSVSGNRNDSFDDILVVSSPRFRSYRMEKIEPFSTNRATTYDEQFLTGFEAEHYKLSLIDGRREADKISDKVIYNRIVASCNCDVVDYINVSTSRTSGTYKYVMLPVWFNYYKYKDNPYYFIMNGETGKKYHKFPVSAGKVLITIGIVLVIGLIIFLLVRNQG